MFLVHPLLMFHVRKLLVPIIEVVLITFIYFLMLVVFSRSMMQCEENKMIVEIELDCRR